MDVIKEESEKENDWDSDSEDSEDEEDREITDSEEQEPVQANISALETLGPVRLAVFLKATG